MPNYQYSTSIFTPISTLCLAVTDFSAVIHNNLRLEGGAAEGSLYVTSYVISVKWVARLSRFHHN